MAGRLVVTSGPDQGQVFTIGEKGPFLVGRSHATATRLSDGRVSRTHCRIDVEGNRFRLSDAGSKSGTFVNGKRISKRDLQPGDVIRIGGSELRFETGDEKPAAPSTAAASPSTAAATPTTTAAPSTAAPAPPPPPEVIPSVHDLEGKQLAHFAIQQNLAAGSTGIVFRADDRKNNRTVALKVLWPEAWQDETETRQFLEMMRSMTSIEHLNIVQLYEADKTGAFCWLSMEYVEGESLGQVIRRIGAAGMLDWRYSYRVALQVGRALEAVHARGIVHRNIAPSNVLVRASDQIVKLADLMFAKAVSSSFRMAKLRDLMAAKVLGGSSPGQVAQAGEPTGDVFYLSPERTEATGEIDIRSDIYSLGALVYALLTGRPQCEGDTLAEVVQKIRYAKPEDPKKFQLAIPEAFADVVLRMLEKRRADRYQRPDELLADLDRIGKYQRVVL